MRRLIEPGDAIASNGLSGRVLSLHPTAVEVEVDGQAMLVPYTSLAQAEMSITRQVDESNE